MRRQALNGRSETIPALETVTLSRTQFHPQAELASHFASAAEEFAKLTPSHPSDAPAFEKGLQELAEVLSGTVFAQHWPGPDERPAVSGPVYREPPRAGGLTKAEQKVGHHLVRIWAGVHKQVPRQQLSQLATAIHHGQDVLQVRALRREHPQFWGRMADALSGVAQMDPQLAGRKAVAHYAKAYQEFQALVTTHPSEQTEFKAGFQSLGTVLREELLQGEWPGQAETSAPDIQVVAPEHSGGLTRSEQLVMHHLNQAARFTAAGLGDDASLKKIDGGLRQCQNILGSRVLRRKYPDYWMATPGSLQQEAQREQARWGHSIPRSAFR